jgi:replicative DNA helicase
MTPEEASEVGGALYTSDLTDGVPLSTNVAHYARQVREHATMRKLQQVGGQILRDAQSFDIESEAALENAEKLVYGVRDRLAVADVLTPAVRSAQAYAQIEALMSQRGVRGVPTGLRELDASLRGLHPGNLVVIGARPSMGKSALALTFAVNASAASSRPALFMSLEMSSDELNMREIAMRSKVDGWKVWHGCASTLEQQSLSAAAAAIGDGLVHVVDTPGLTVGRIRALARRAKAQHGLSVVVVDYLQLIASDRERGRREANRTEEVGEQSRALKLLARELEVPVVLLSQLSRALESRTEKRPMLSDLRESGAIEQDADVVLFLYRDHVYNRSAPEDEAEILIGKQRNGPTGTVKASFRRSCTLFEDAVGVA